MAELVCGLCDALQYYSAAFYVGSKGRPWHDDYKSAPALIANKGNHLRHNVIMDLFPLKEKTALTPEMQFRSMAKPTPVDRVVNPKLYAHKLISTQCSQREACYYAGVSIAKPTQRSIGDGRC